MSTTLSKRNLPEKQLFEKISCPNCHQEVMGTPPLRAGFDPVLVDHYCLSDDFNPEQALESFLRAAA